MPKFFTDLTYRDHKDGFITITGGDAAHIVNVLRGKPGDSIIVCDGQGTDMACEIMEIGDGRVIMAVLDSAESGTEPAVCVTLYQGLPKGDKMEYIIQKAVELGVYEIVPVITEYTIVKIKENGGRKIDRYTRIAQAAAKQCMRGIVPRVTGFMSFAEALRHSGELDLAFAAYENEHKTSLRDVLTQRDFRTVGIFIGPEGGFSPKEAGMFSQNRISTVTLGKRILRTETAGLAAIAIVNYEMET